MRTLQRYWRPGALALLVIVLTVVVVRTALAGPATTPRPADVELSTRSESPPGQQHDLRLERPDGEWIGGLGLVEPALPESRLGAAVAGRIGAIHVREGERVVAGALLVELESGPEQAALAAAEADVAIAQAQLVLSRRGVRADELDALTSEAQAAVSRAELSEGVLSRLEAASRGGGVTVDELERARREADAQRLAALTATSRRRAGQSGRREEVMVAQAQLDAAIARRDQARATLERFRITAPIDAEILELHFRVGEYVSPGGTEPLVVLGDTRTLRARIDVDERDVARLEIGALAQITVDAFPGRRFEGRVVGIARRMGRKNVRTDEPTERIDTKILETVVELGEDARVLVVGQRVMGYVAPSEE